MMNPSSLQKAKSRLRTATKAVNELEMCNTFEGATDIWFSFLTAAKSVYTSLEQGAKASARSRQWFGGKQNDRRADDLLQYVYQARNDDEHGLGPVLEHMPGEFRIGANVPGGSNQIHVKNFAMRGGRIVQLDVESLDDKPVVIEQILPHARLIPVRDRGGRIYSPPQSHLGADLRDNSPLAVAKLALAYLSTMVKDAEGLQ